MSATQALPPIGVRRLRVSHETRYEYEDGVEIAHHLAFLKPRQTGTQRIERWTLEVEPAPDAADPPASRRAGRVGGTQDAALHSGIRLSNDCWGNWRASFSHARVHERLIVRSRFVAALRSGDAPEAQKSPRWEGVARSMGYRPGAAPVEAAEFALPTRLAGRDPALAALAREVFLPARPLLEGAIALMHLIHAGFTYAPASTSVNTLATESLAQRRGVCQDFAHVMIGAMRSIGLPARYVSGYLLTQPPPGRPRLVGADATHAWVDVWCPINGWVALDPTNGMRVGKDHVTVAWGRDYADVAPLRGVIRGGGLVEPRVAVTVEPTDEAAV